MSGPLRIALLADGTSDIALWPVLIWLLRQLAPARQVASPDFLARRTSDPIVREMERASELFRPDVLFVHRDAEGEDPEIRRAEIPVDEGVVVRVVPVRMTEAWLLFDEAAIRRAAGVPNGRAPLDLPTVRRIENIPDPKTFLRNALLVAAEVSGRHRKRFQQSIATRVHRVAELIEDFSVLQRLEAFSRLASDCKAVLSAVA